MAELDQWINPAGGEDRNSMQYLLSSGTQTSFEFNFKGGYIRQVDVKAYIYHTATGLTTQIDPVVLTGPNTIEVVPVVPDGDYLVVYRDTQKSQPLVDFVSGAVMNEENLDIVAQQSVFAAAEMVDRFAEIKSSSDDAIVRSATALATANIANDKADSAVSTANSADGKATAAVITAFAADAKADSATNTANGIDGKAQTALDNSVTAVTTANIADGKAGSAVTTANGIDGKAQTALDNSGTAVSTANGIAGTANTALSQAGSAVTTANTALSQAGSAVTTANTALSYVLPVIQTNYFWSPGKSGSCFVKTGSDTLSVLAGTVLIADGTIHKYLTSTAVAMPSLVGGTDYDVWIKPTGALQAVATSYASPSMAPISGSVRVGGFHYGLVAPGTTPASGGFSTSGLTGSGGSYIWDQAKVDRIAGINEFTMWSLDWCCAGEQLGMTLDPQTRYWNAIYFCSTDHEVNGISKAGTNIASGTVFPKIPTVYGGDGTMAYTRFSYYEALEVVLSHGVELYNYNLSCSGLFGVTEGISLGGAASTVPMTLRQPGYTSRIGVEQATGHQFIIGGPLSSVGGSAYVGEGRGSFYGSSGLPLYGGSRADSANSGSRAALFNSVPGVSYWGSSVRAVGCLRDRKGTGIAFSA